MSNEKSHIPLTNCDNHYSEEELFDNFGMSENEIKICLNCSNHRMEYGIITCKYIIEGCGNNDSRIC